MNVQYATEHDNILNNNQFAVGYDFEHCFGSEFQDAVGPVVEAIPREAEMYAAALSQGCWRLWRRGICVSGFRKKTAQCMST